MYELANSFRHGWGVEKDPIAARSYYETAANLGDTDAMNEVARCYEEGFGGKKDKVSGSRLFWQLFFLSLWLVFLFYLIHSRGFGGKGFTTSSSFSWDWREVFFFWGNARRKDSQNARSLTRYHSYFHLSFFNFKAKNRLGCDLWHIPSSQVYLFILRGKTNTQVLGCWAAMRFFLTRDLKKKIPRLTSFFFLFDTQFKAAKYYRLAEENGSRTLGNSWYVISSLLPTFLLSLASFFFFFRFLSLPRYRILFRASLNPPSRPVIQNHTPV